MLDRLEVRAEDERPLHSVCAPVRLRPVDEALERSSVLVVPLIEKVNNVQGSHRLHVVEFLLCLRDRKVRVASLERQVQRRYHVQREIMDAATISHIYIFV